MRRLPVLLLVTLVLATACRQSELRLDAGDSALPGGRQEAPEGDVITDPDEVVARALADLETFWTEALPEAYDVEFTPLRGGYVAYGPQGPLPQCGDQLLGYDDIAENALYCPDSDLIAWDRVNLMPQLQQQYGALTAGIVMAHEFAHAVQSRGGVEGVTVTLELQADCFAGAWVSDVDDREPTFTTVGDALDQALAGLLELRDQVGVSASDPQAHGSGFDRINAFQQGFQRGIDTCVDFEDQPPTVVAIPFSSPNDLYQGGNLPLERLFDPLVADLESFYTALFAEMGRSWDAIDGFVALDPADGPVECGDDTVPRDDLELASFYCVADDTFYVDGEGLIPELDEIGDFAFGGELARLYAVAAQSRLGWLDDDPTGLHADCFTGVYSAAEYLGEIPDQQLALSPGDLDEIIVAFLAFGEEGDVTAFERTDAFRVGFLGGASSCERFLR